MIMTLLLLVEDQVVLHVPRYEKIALKNSLYMKLLQKLVSSINHKSIKESLYFYDYYSSTC